MHPIQPENPLDSSLPSDQSPFAADQPPASFESSEFYYAHAGFWLRFFAYIIDIILVLILTYMLLFTLNILGFQHLYDYKNLVAGTLFLIYNFLLVWYEGATVGKMVMKLRVVDKDNKKPPLLHIFLREVPGKMVSGMFFEFGYIWVAIDEKREAWHDKIAKTHVIQMNPVSKEVFLESEMRRHNPLPFILIFAAGMQSLFCFTYISIGFITLEKLTKENNRVFVTIMLILIALIIITEFATAVVLILKQKKEELSEKSKIFGTVILGIGLNVVPVLFVLLFIFGFVLPLKEALTRRDYPSVTPGQSNGIEYRPNSNLPTPYLSPPIQQKPFGIFIPPADWDSYTMNNTISFQYPSSWAITNKTDGIIEVYDPNSIVQKPTNGGAEMPFTSRYVRILSVQNTTTTAQEIADKYIYSWTSNNPNLDLQRQTYSDNGIQYEIYNDTGEGSYGKNIIISNGKTLVQINASINDVSIETPETEILSTLKFVE